MTLWCLSWFLAFTGTGRYQSWAGGHGNADSQPLTPGQCLKEASTQYQHFLYLSSRSLPLLLIVCCYLVNIGTHPKTLPENVSVETLATEGGFFLNAAVIVLIVASCSANDSAAVGVSYGTDTEPLTPAANHCGGSLLVNLNL